MKPNTFLITFVTISIIACNKPSPSEKYDEKTNQQLVMTHSGLDSVLNALETVKYEDLPDHYISYCDLNGKFCKHYHNREFYVIHGDEMYKYLAGHCRIRDFLPEDRYFKACVSASGSDLPQYLFIKREVLHKLMALIQTLKARGYNAQAFKVYHGWRHPTYNKEIKGASLSQHLQGNAIDIKIGDIDRNGVVSKKDKAIVLDILENEIIGEEGGIGRYPHSQCIHFDIRGYGARWDSY